MSVAQDSALDTNDGSTTDRYIVEVQGISKFYEPDTQALLDVDLGFPEGEMTTLLGPSWRLTPGRAQNERQQQPAHDV